MSLSVIPVSNETKNTTHRTTKDGRRIRYDLQVIQQPERARACGSGAKSSADRRPVDPPPIVELRIYENDQDVTFAYNANFFLHASLENARPLAAGRGAPSISSSPVLTGTPVAGMAYLDRPTPAGYFIFPDLSVRHEGKYRLSFALLENLSEVKDLDPDDPNVIHDGNRFVTNRCEVKSAPFVVFSAKKFPGLSESTALSRMVAEQGCRVRIRRDVRMRRRENKGSKEWDEYGEEEGYTRRTPTPESYGGQPGMPAPGAPMAERPRSLSNASNSSLVPPRRPSMEEMAQGYQQPTTNYQQMPPPQNTGYSHMPPQPQYQPQYQQQQQQQQQQQYAPPPASHMMQPPQPSYSQPPQQQPPQHQPQHQPQPAYNNAYQSHSSMPINQSYGYPSHQQPQQQQQPHYEPRQEQPAAQHQPIDYRRPSIPQPTQQYAPSSQPQLMSPYSPVDPYQPRSQSMSQPMHTPTRASSISGPSSMHPHNSHALPTLKTLQPPLSVDKLEPVSPSYPSPLNTMSSGTMSANSDAPNSNYAMHNYPASNLPPMSSSTGQKRSFSNTFDQTHLTGRLTQGARPSLSGPGYTYDEPDMEEPMDRAAMSYRRADGTQRQRHVPEVNV